MTGQTKEPKRINQRARSESSDVGRNTKTVEETQKLKGRVSGRSCGGWMTWYLASRSRLNITLLSPISGGRNFGLEKECQEYKELIVNWWTTEEWTPCDLEVFAHPTVTWAQTNRQQQQKIKSNLGILRLRRPVLSIGKTGMKERDLEYHVAERGGVSKLVAADGQRLEPRDEAPRRWEQRCYKGVERVPCISFQGSHIASSRIPPRASPAASRQA
ncbi:hypothetical protein FB451DRAFT_1172437 [Mycena latifolia]|nr:hypothetical protein FB451DRAFT_1172437 [Mycena latifolia]